MLTKIVLVKDLKPKLAALGLHPTRSSNMKILKYMLLIVGVSFAANNISAPALAGDDPARGKKVFKKCKACHKIVAGKKSIGPSLHGMFGRKAGTLKKFKYSKDMKAAGKKGLVWNAETFVAFIAKPKKYLGSVIGKKRARTKMSFNGLKKSKDRVDLLSYLMKVTK